MSLKKMIETLVKTTDKDNAAIFTFLRESGINCSKRTVRRYANPVRSITRDGPQPTEVAKILLLDIETAPMEVFAWRLDQKWIPESMIIKDRSVLSWSAKWLFDADVMGESVKPTEAMDRRDGSVIFNIWNLLDAADIVIAHNGNQFDTKILNTRFAINGLKPPMPYRTIDTLRVAKSNFNLPSYKLDYINRLFKLTPKRWNEGFNLWRRCVNGDSKALAEMLEYNKIDIVALEECYLELRPWIKSHPNIALFISTDKEICTNCGSETLDWGGRYITPAGRYKAFRCGGCGAIGRSRYSDLTTEEKERMFVSVAR